MDKDYYCNTVVMKHHLNTSTYQKVDSNSDERVFNNLKFLIKKHESCSTKNKLKYILNSNWKLLHCLNMQPPEDLKRRPIVGCLNSPTQGISGLLEKVLTPIS